MLKDAKVFICDDWNMDDNMAEITEGLLAQGVTVIRGPKTERGVKLIYKEADYPLFEDADVLMFSSRSVCDRNVIDAAKKAKALVFPTIGADTTDVPYAREKGLILGNGAIPQNALSVAEANIMHMLMAMHKPLKSLEITAGKTKKPSMRDMWSEIIFGKTVGMIGMGRIAKLIAERLHALGVNIVSYDPYLPPDKFPEYVARCETLEEMLPQADIVGLYVVVNETTTNIINKRTLSMMKPSAHLINTSRGQTVNEEDLYEALKNGVISGATLDVTAVEPFPMDSKLRELDNVLVYPHVAGYTRSNYLGITPAAIENIMSVLNGQPPKYCMFPADIAAWKNRFAAEYAERGVTME